MALARPKRVRLQVMIQGLGGFLFDFLEQFWIG